MEEKFKFWELKCKMLNITYKESTINNKLKEKLIMINAKAEFLKEIKTQQNKGKKVKCAIVTFTSAQGTEITVKLPINYSKQLFYDFLNNLDFEYNPLSKALSITGTIWYEYKNKVFGFSRRDIYNKNQVEAWHYYQIPRIPKELFN